MPGLDCSACGNENRSGRRFCAECGAPLAPSCAACGAANEAGEKFCGECGAALGAAKPAPGAVGRDPRAYTPKHLADKILRSKAAVEGERKQVTVLFADVKGSLELAEQVDPENWHRILDRFFQILTDGVHRFEGSVNQYTGDGIMALFGAPIAHEDHAHRACYAALHLRRELREFATELRREQGLSFSTRVGLNSGEVVVGKIGDDLRMDYTAQGHTVGLAARMEELAEPGTTYMTAHTAQMVDGYFNLRELGDFALKGVRDRLAVYELEDVGSHRTRLDVSRARGFSHFVGRSNELETLERAFVQAREGSGQVVGVVGQAGLGKSRLCHEFVERRRREGVPLMVSNSPPHGKSLPFHATLQILRALFGVAESDSPHDVRTRVAGTLSLLSPELRDDLPLLFDFLGVPDPAFPVPELSSEARERRLLGFMRELQRARSEREPSVVLMDDLHWADASSDAFLAHVIEGLESVRTLIVVNFRPEYTADWMQRSHYQQIALRPLGPDDMAELLDHLLGPDPSTTALRTRIAERTAGNPFFVEEVVHGLAESGALAGERGAYRLLEPDRELEIPDSVRSILAARIDRLGELEKRVLQTAAVIGSEFAVTLLREVVGVGEEELQTALSTLVQREFLQELAIYPEAEYGFRHPLIQEVAYGTQLGERRAALHAATALALERIYEDVLDERASLISRHYEEATDWPQAARWRARAAEWALDRDSRDAALHWKAVHQMLERCPESEEQKQLALSSCRWGLELAWRMTTEDRNADALLEEGEQLARALEDPHALAALHSSYLQYAYITPGKDYHRAARTALELSRAAEASDVEVSILNTLGMIELAEGKLSEAAASVDRCLQVCGGDARLGFDIRGASPLAHATGMRAQVHVYCGELDQAERKAAEAVELCREHALLESQVMADRARCELAFARGDLATARQTANDFLELAERFGTHSYRAGAEEMLGRALQLDRSAADQAVAALERAQELYAQSWPGYHYVIGAKAALARSLADVGEPERAAQVARECLAEADGNPAMLAGIEAESVLAHALILIDPSGQAAEIERRLGTVEARAAECGARLYGPAIHLERALHARALADEVAYERELRTGHRLYVEMGAHGHAQRIERALARL